PSGRVHSFLFGAPRQGATNNLSIAPWGLTRVRALAIVAILALVTPVLATALAVSGAPAAPGWWEDTIFDRDHDGLDDRLVDLDPSAPFVVLVDYASVPGPRELAAIGALGVEVTSSYHDFPVLAVRALPAQLPALRALPGVVMIEKNDVIYPLLKDSVPLIGAPQAWSTYGATGKGITIAVIDDGAFEQHPALSASLDGHFDSSTPSQTTSTPLSGIIAPAANTEGHGTHVAGIIVSNGANSDGGVYKGVAPDAKFANVKVFSTANQTTSDFVMGGLQWALDNAKAHNIRIASMSLGGSPSDGNDAISRAVNIAVEKGMIVVAAAGNAGPGKSTITAPGAAANAITVGAVDKQKKLAPYSSRGPTMGASPRLKPDIMAPGSDITSTAPPAGGASDVLRSKTDGLFYKTLSGTSMAAPHVSGVVAMMLQVNPGLSPKDVKDILLATALQSQDLGVKGPDNETGYGFVNAIAAVQVAKDPKILEQPQFASILQSLPDTQQSSFLDKASFEASTLAHSGKLWLL